MDNWSCFDFYLPQKNICIECNGLQHYQQIEYFGGKEKYENQIYLDNIKKQYCEKHHINLIIIP